MTYTSFVNELDRGMEGEIIAHTSPQQMDGCLIYLRSGKRTVFIPADIIRSLRRETIAFLINNIRNGLPRGPNFRISVQNDELTIDDVPSVA